ncbi:MULTISPECIES: hypothetical protein [Vibrio]|uniref:hypothetical protein n=1 Tax=Vibrio TaxID=662 RepID=UPI003D14055A
MKNTLLFSSLLTFNSLITFDSYAQVLPPEQTAHYQLVCQGALNAHGLRLFDALANSEFLDWTLIKTAQQTSRVNYTRTVDTLGERTVHCDAVIQYQYDHKNVVIKTMYVVDQDRDSVRSELAELDEAVRDFLVQLMV